VKVKIFSIRHNTRDSEQEQNEKNVKLEAQVNDFLENQPGTVQWLQDSASGQYKSFTQITAIVSY
jgi:hypothetical protein